MQNKALEGSIIESALGDDSRVAHELQEVEGLTKEIKRLLVNSESTLTQEGVRQQAEVLERWLESYRRGLSAAYKISRTGMEYLQEMRNRLSLALDEMHRLEGEGGMPASKEQVKHAEDLRLTLSRVDNLIATLEKASFQKEVSELETTD